jgi:hypothetical protein
MRMGEILSNWDMEGIDRRLITNSSSAIIQAKCRGSIET